MEISIGSYGRMIFEQMTNKPSSMPDHWHSIRKEAEPLVRQLIDLNDKMKPSGYTIVGYKDRSGKNKLSKAQRIKKTQETWKVSASTLKEGDRFWTCADSDIEMYITQDDPVIVDEVGKKGIYFELSHCGGHHTERIDSSDMVFKAPDDFKGKEDLYASEEYWLEQADKLGI